MRNTLLTVQFLGCLFALLSCQHQPEQNNDIFGLWQVQSVQMGEQEMTPIARWMQFNADSTQTSGNGWYQHSEGYWTLKDGMLSIDNTNGVKDEAGAFKVDINANTMVWQRTEDGSDLKVRLERIATLPKHHKDEILGLWQLNGIQHGGPYMDTSASEHTTLFIKWDKRFDLKTDSTTIRGVYQVHGHRKQLTLVPTNQNLSMSRWKFEINSGALTLTSSNDSLISSFKRIHQFIH